MAYRNHLTALVGDDQLAEPRSITPQDQHTLLVACCKRGMNKQANDGSNCHFVTLKSAPQWRLLLVYMSGATKRTHGETNPFEEARTPRSCVRINLIGSQKRRDASEVTSRDEWTLWRCRRKLNLLLSRTGATTLGTANGNAYSSTSDWRPEERIVTVTRWAVQVLCHSG